MSRERVKPTREASTLPGDRDGYSEKHPAYGMIGASRVQAGPPGHRLFGTDFLHGNYVVLSIKRASVDRRLSSDWYHADSRTPIVEVGLSEAHWVSLVAAMNVGDGVPCTIEFTEKDGPVPGIDAITDRREQVRGEVEKTLEDVLKSLDELAVEPKLNGANREKARFAAQNLRSNLPYIQERFDKHADTTIQRAKVEISAYVTQMAQRTGFAALAGGDVPVLTLAEGEEGEVIDG